MMPSPLGKAVRAILEDNLTLSEPPDSCGSNDDDSWNNGDLFFRFDNRDTVIHRF